MLGRLEAGDPFDRAVRATTGLTLDQFEDGWRRAVRTRYTVITWLVAGGVWAVIGVGLVALGRWRRRDIRARRAALDQGWVVPDDPDAA